MLLKLENIEAIYQKISTSVEKARKVLNRPLSLTEKLLYGHLYDEVPSKPYQRGRDYVNFRIDRVAMQDATAQMALLQFMTAGRPTSAVPATVHCDHLILAKEGVSADLQSALSQNAEVYDFLQSVY